MAGSIQSLGGFYLAIHVELSFFVFDQSDTIGDVDIVIRLVGSFV